MKTLVLSSKLLQIPIARENEVSTFIKIQPKIQNIDVQYAIDLIN